MRFTFTIPLSAAGPGISVPSSGHAPVSGARALLDRPNWYAVGVRSDVVLEPGVGFAYKNPDTGVEFSAFLDAGGMPVFAVPVAQSSVVGLQAAREVAGVALAVGADQALARSAFLRGWNECNQASIAEIGDTALRTLPESRLAAVWRWNDVRLAHIERLCSVELLPCTVPRVGFYGPPGADHTTVMTGVVWNAMAPMALPEVDLLVIPVGELGGPREHGDASLGVTALPQVALRPLLAAFARREAGHRFGRSGIVHDPGLAHWLLDYVSPPSELSQAIRALAVPRRLVPLDVHVVLDRELVDGSTGRGPPSGEVLGRALSS